MKKLLKSGICGSINSTLMYCLLQKSQHLRLLFIKQYINSNHVSPKRVKKKKKMNKNVKHRRGSKHTLSAPLKIAIYIFIKFDEQDNNNK